MVRYENSKDSREVEQKSSTYLFTGKNEIELEETSKSIGHPVMRNWKMNFLPEVMIEVLKQRSECGSTSFELRGKRGERGCAFQFSSLVVVKSLRGEFWQA